MKYYKFITFLTLSFLFLNKFLHSNEVPVIVIAPSKSPQSISTVGSSVVVLDEKFFKETNEIFLGDMLSLNSTSINFFQNGGYGTTSGIQLRGLPKRYSTVFIDGVKMSDPSSVSGDFDFNHILVNQIDRVEILKGNQSSIYGSGAIGGTINITTKKFNDEEVQSFNLSNGSNSTRKISLQKSKKFERSNFFISLDRFSTNGISQMSHNDEKDAYRNNSLVTKYETNFNEKLKFETNLRYRDSYLQYDKELHTATADHSEEEDGKHIFSSGKLTYKLNKNFQNSLSLSKSYNKRIYGAAPNSGNILQDNYYGERYTYDYFGEYNFNLDNKIIFGSQREDDAIEYNPNLSGNKRESYTTISNYFDFQKRFSNNLFATIGSRLEENSIAGDEEAHRATFAYYLNDKKTKFKGSLGTGFRFPSLYEMYYVYAANNRSLGSVKAEHSKSFDIGVEKTFLDKNFDLDLTYFNIEYSDVLEGWKTGNSSGLNYTTQNMPGTVKSQGIELSSLWRKNNYLNFGINYTYTSTYDGAEQDDPDKSSSYYNSQIVRVPRHLINLNTSFKFPNYNNLDFTINSKWSDEARDYGNGNRTYNDERIKKYFVNDFNMNYKLYDSIKFYFNITNLFDEDYETARDYSQLGRSINFGLKKIR